MTGDMPSMDTAYHYWLQPEWDEVISNSRYFDRRNEMTEQLTLLEEPQWARVWAMLREGPKTTNDFCSAPGLAAEYRRAICDLKTKLRKMNTGWTVASMPLTKKNWEYRLVREMQVAA